ncbi:uncharacterized protein EDB91DRAFT_1267593 [Suillus paluster]|uniref:uncharacterized protein n=1 Tax=Suillus paluster TaxID=48578 RepID=UPI001B873906|nr:uncharacterized protein EDB91DRAFT_1267593 [Suillus paluster]KAG1725059.1 hypothetical protein EDB91DRAFT_1267593 [Suillus paluster]
MSQLIPSTIPLRTFKDHTGTVFAVAVFPDRRRMVTGSYDKTLRLWDLQTGAVLKKMEGHRDKLRGLAVSRNGRMIASGDTGGEFMAWHGETGEPLTKEVIRAHSSYISSMDFSLDGTTLVSGSGDTTTKLWNTKTWQVEGNPIKCSNSVRCVRYSPSGEHLGIATDTHIEIYKSYGTRERVAIFKGHTKCNWSLVWTLDSKRLLSGGDEKDPTIREWDTSNWQQVGGPWTGHTHHVYNIAIHPAGRYIASASDDNHVRLWQLSDQRTIAIFQHSSATACVTFSMSGKHILSGGGDTMISEWEAPKGVNLEILSFNATARDACITGDLSTAKEVFTQEIDADVNNYTSYANRSFVIAREYDWDHALDDASKSVAIQPSLAGHVSKGIALCGQGKVQDATIEFDLAFMFANEDSKIAIAIFNAGQHKEVILRVRKLAAVCPNNDTLACCAVEAYLCVQLGINAANHNEAVDYFIAAVDASAFSSTLPINSIYEDLVVLFGWDLKSLWKNARQKQCDALRQAGRHEEAVESHRRMMDTSDEDTKANCLDWSNAFMQEYSAPYIANGDAAFAASDYEKAIKYTLWQSTSIMEVTPYLQTAVIELNPSSYVGYQRKYVALYGAKNYKEAMAACQMMIAKLESAHDMQIRTLREKYGIPSEKEGVIRKVIDIQLDTAPLRLLNTATGLLCDREAQINAFKTSAEYNELLLSLTVKHPDIRLEHITEVVVTYFRCVMLSHRWEGTEPLLHHIKDKVVYEMMAAGGLVKLQSFCKIARKAGYHWAWVDSCCIDQHNNVELQKSLNSMFAWYHDSALTVVYLSDVPPLSRSGALAKSAWNTRGWTVPEFLAPKESDKIMHELQDATGIDARTLVAFQPGMRDAREKLQWVSMRVTTVPEDIAYSLFGIFGVQLPILYGENKQNALGRLLQEIVARSGDITALNWVGQPSQFNSCLPANISSYAAPPCALPSLSEDEIQIAVSSLRNTVAAELASELYYQLDSISCSSLHGLQTASALHRIPYHRNGLHDLLLTTKETLNQFTPAKPPLQTFLFVLPWDRRLLELPDFAEVPDFGDDTQSEGTNYWSAPGSPIDELPGGSPVEQEPVDSEPYSRALRVIVRLGQPFSAFLLARQRGGEYKRIASDFDIIAQVQNVASVQNIMDGVRTLEIL